MPSFNKDTNRLLLIVLVLTGVFLGAAQEASAASIYFQTDTKNAVLGSTVSMEPLFSGFNDPQLGHFDLEVGYNSTILGFSGIAFGDPTRGDQLNTDGLAYQASLGPYSLTSPNSAVNLIETASSLPAVNFAEYLLATISFSTLAAGSAELWININSLRDGSGTDIGLIYAGIGQINVTSPPPQAVPEAAAAWLLGSGLLGLVALKRKFQR